MALLRMPINSSFDIFIYKFHNTTLPGPTDGRKNKQANSAQGGGPRSKRIYLCDNLGDFCLNESFYYLSFMSTLARLFIKQPTTIDSEHLC